MSATHPDSAAPGSQHEIIPATDDQALHDAVQSAIEDAQPDPVENPRTVLLIILTVLAVLFAIQWAQKFLIPMAFGILIAYTLNPVVVWLERLRLPRALATSLVIGLICVGGVLAADNLQRETRSILDQIPIAAQKIGRAISKLQGNQPSTVQQVQQAAAEIEKATTGQAPANRKPQPPPPAQPLFKVTEWLWAGSMSAVGFVAQAIMVLFLVFFLLLAGDSFKRKVVKIVGPTMSQKKIAVHILDDINASIQGYMFMLLVTNLLLTVVIWLSFRLIGLENAGAWAVAAGLFHLIPYFGPLLITIGSGVAAFMQFESLYIALVVAGCSLTIATLVGTFVQTWMVGKIARMNPAAVFIGLLFWGWLWGLWGLLLGIPIIVIVKVFAENVGGRLEPIVELLAE